MPTKKKRTQCGPRKQQPSLSIRNFRAARAAMLDRLADQQLQAGFHNQAERLAHQAAELREHAR